jgi:hypothetical protein
MRALSRLVRTITWVVKRALSRMFTVIRCRPAALDRGEPRTWPWMRPGTIPASSAAQKPDNQPPAANGVRGSPRIAPPVLPSSPSTHIWPTWSVGGLGSAARRVGVFVNDSNASTRRINPDPPVRVRPHESLGQIAPMVRYLAEPLPPAPEPNLSDPYLSRILDAGQWTWLENVAIGWWSDLTKCAGSVAVSLQELFRACPGTFSTSFTWSGLA